jgi:hypothetical protein
MTDELLTAEDLAERLHISVDLVRRRTKADKWPHVRFGGKTIRYRNEHVDAIVALYDNAGTPVRSVGGQTAGSRRRSA